jgi:hypothetical protein
MNRFSTLFLAVLALTGCAGEPETEKEEGADPCPPASLSAAKVDPHTQDFNLNLTVFLDLSDRIDTTKYPDATMQFYRRDLAYIAAIANGYSVHCRSRKTRQLSERIQFYPDPSPSSNEVNDLTQQMKLHLTKDNATKDQVCGLVEHYAGLSERLYELAINESKFPGSNIWGFFQNKARNACIVEGAVNRLIILTDGYVYHESNKRDEGPHTSYIVPESLNKLGLTGADWKSRMEKMGYGLIPATSGLDSLEVMVLGVSNGRVSPYEGDVLKAFWTDWLSAMGVKNMRIEFAELPAALNEPIQSFVLRKP